MLHQTYTADVLVVGGGTGGTAACYPSDGLPLLLRYKGGLRLL
ncbi:hypothetical protein [Nostoc sp. NOS(2021)]|nr:hypothetical protein [Nostoc sp. NOS(2021)]